MTAQPNFDFPGPTSDADRGLYRHFKTGKIYIVLGTVLNTDTKTPMVLYQAVYEGIKLPYLMSFVKSRETFFEKVEFNNQLVQRFQPLPTSTSMDTSE